MIFQLTQFIEAYLEKHNKKPLSFYEQMLLRQKQQELEERERELRVYIYIYQDSLHQFSIFYSKITSLFIDFFLHFAGTRKTKSRRKSL